MQQFKHLSFPLTILMLVVLAIVGTACSLSTAPARGADELIVSPTGWTPNFSTATSTPRPTNTPQPTATSTRVTTGGTTGNVSYQPPAYSINQRLPAAICGVYPSASGAVNVRSGPGLQFPVIGLLPAGHWALARHIDPSGNWYQINIPNTPVDGGWVSDSVVFIQTPCSCGTNSGCNPIPQPQITWTPTHTQQPQPQITNTPPSPLGACVVHVAIQGDVPIYNQPNPDAGEWGRLGYGGQYQVVTGITSDGWYAIGISGGPAIEPGILGMKWIRNDGTVQISGPCDHLPTFDYQYPTPNDACRLEVLPGGSVPVYRYPSMNSDIWATMEEGWSYPLVGATDDGWYAFDPVAAQAANIGIWRLRWIRIEAPVQVTGCDSWPRVDYHGGYGL